MYLLHTEKKGKGNLSDYQAEQVLSVLQMMKEGGGNRGYQETTVMVLLKEEQKKELCRMFSHAEEDATAKPPEPKGKELEARVDDLIPLLETKVKGSSSKESRDDPDSTPSE